MKVKNDFGAWISVQIPDINIIFVASCHFGGGSYSLIVPTIVDVQVKITVFYATQFNMTSFGLVNLFLE